MASFLVEIYTPATGPSAAIHRRMRAASAELRRTGTPIQYLRSTFVREDEMSFYLFEAEAAEAVRKASVKARIPAVRIVEAVELYTVADPGSAALPRGTRRDGVRR